MNATTTRLRREPPQFRHVTVRGVEQLTPHLKRVTIAGPDLEGFELPEPAASVRLLLPPPGAREFVVPTWNGNEFLLADGSRPTIRTLTPLRVGLDAQQLDVEIVMLGHGALSEWPGAAEQRLPLAISGPGRGYAIDADAAFLLASNDSAIPAIGRLLEALSRD